MEHLEAQDPEYIIGIIQDTIAGRATYILPAHTGPVQLSLYRPQRTDAACKERFTVVEKAYDYSLFLVSPSRRPRGDPPGGCSRLGAALPCKRHPSAQIRRSLGSC